MVSPPRGRVLVIDDDAGVSDALRAALDPHADVVADATALHALVRLARGEVFDLILCDNQTPGALGTDFMVATLHFAPAAASAIVLLCAAAPPAAPDVPCLAKPVDVAAVRALLETRIAARTAG